MTPRRLRALRYARISDDKTGLEAGVTRQLRRADEIIADHPEWDDISAERPFVDNDRSAFRKKGRKPPRPDFNDIIELVRSDSVDILVGYHVDRFYRDVRELEDLIDLVETYPVSIVTKYGDFDLNTVAGRLAARVGVIIAQAEVENTRRRVQERNVAKRQNGEPHAPRAFGYLPAMTTGPDGKPQRTYDIEPAEAQLIREAAVGVLAGEGVKTIARRWTEAGVPTVRGAAAWSPPVVRQILRNPIYAGRLSSRDDRGGFEDAGPGSGNWPAILDDRTHERLVALFDDPARRRRNPPRRTIFTGLVHCGVCGHAMVRGKTHANGMPQWQCKAIPGRPNCGRVNIMAEPVNRAIVNALLIRGDTGELIAHEGGAAGNTAVDDANDALRKVAETRQELSQDYYVDHAISRAEWQAARRGLDDREASARAVLARSTRHAALADFPNPGDLRKAWEAGELSDDRKRAILRAAYDRVVIHPARSGTGTSGSNGGIDMTRVDFEWRA